MSDVQMRALKSFIHHGLAFKKGAEGPVPERLAKELSKAGLLEPADGAGDGAAGGGAGGDDASDPGEKMATEAENKMLSTEVVANKATPARKRASR